MYVIMIKYYLRPSSRAYEIKMANSVSNSDSKHLFIK